MAYDPLRDQQSTVTTWVWKDVLLQQIVKDLGMDSPPLLYEEPKQPKIPLPSRQSPTELYTLKNFF